MINGSNVGPDRAVLESFAGAMFKHADEESFISLRAFEDNREVEKPVFIDGFKVSHPKMLDWVFNRAKQAADHDHASVFCPALATFTNGSKASQDTLANGLSLSVDCDQRPNEARRLLVGLLGEPTFTVSSGGEWTNPQTGEVEPKIHMHWRLTEPTRDAEGHAKLKLARQLACAIVGGDPTGAPVVHGLRWPGSVHRKQAPRLAAIVATTENEIELDAALDVLRLAAPEGVRHGSGKIFEAFAAADAPIGERERLLHADLLDIVAALAVLPNEDASQQDGCLRWDGWNLIGMAAWKASDGQAFAAFDAWSRKSPKYSAEATSARWAHYFSSPPEKVGAGMLFMLAERSMPGWRRPSSYARGAQGQAGAGERADTGAQEPRGAGSKPKAERKAKRRPENDTRPVISLRAGAISEAVDAVEAALIARGGLYQRANRIVFIGSAPTVTYDHHRATAVRIFERGEAALGEDITQAACLVKWDARANDDVVIDAPTRLVSTLVERVGRFRLPILTGVISTPTLRPDGTLLEQPGYDMRTGLFFDPRGVEFPTVPAEPTRIDAERALADLGELLLGFPFVGDDDRAVALSAIMTACVRSGLPTAPMHGISATEAGSGKGKLVDVASMIATGQPAGVIAQAADDVEMEKRLGALLLEGAGAIAIDNCTYPIDGNFLCAILTQTTTSIRPLGGSKTVTVPTNAFLTCTGNNLVVSGDMTRRAVVCRLDAKVERPELREFDFDPVERAKEGRVKYVVAALTVLLAFKATGSPQQARPLGSFEAWSRLVRDALLWLGCGDPVRTMESARQKDPKLGELSEVLAHWERALGTNGITVRRIIDKATKQTTGDGFGYAQREFEQPDMREALMAVAGQGGVNLRMPARQAVSTGFSISLAISLSARVGRSSALMSAIVMCLPIHASDASIGGLGESGGFLACCFGLRCVILQLYETPNHSAVIDPVLLDEATTHDAPGLGGEPAPQATAVGADLV